MNSDRTIEELDYVAEKLNELVRFSAEQYFKYAVSEGGNIFYSFSWDLAFSGTDGIVHESNVLTFMYDPATKRMVGSKPDICARLSRGLESLPFELAREVGNALVNHVAQRTLDETSDSEQFSDGSE